jgi:hypothetical protein
MMDINKEFEAIRKSPTATQRAKVKAFLGESMTTANRSLIENRMNVAV